MQEVSGSIPLGSTIPTYYTPSTAFGCDGPRSGIGAACGGSPPFDVLSFAPD